MRLTCSAAVAALALWLGGVGAAAAQPDLEDAADHGAPDADPEATGEEGPPDRSIPDDAPIDPEDDSPLTEEEIATARPELPEGIDLPDAPEWSRHLEVGADVLFVNRPFAEQLGEVGTISYKSAIGWGVHLRWEVLEYLRFEAYLLDARHRVELSKGALATSASTSVSREATPTELTARTFSFGARAQPTLPLSDRARVWLTASVGWGRFTFPEMFLVEPDGLQVTVRQRNGVFVEFPLGFGLSFDVIPRWLAIDYQATAAPVIDVTGDGHESFQGIDADGNVRDVGPFSAIEATFVQMLGLSLIL